MLVTIFFFFQAEDGIRYLYVTGVQTCALPIWPSRCGLAWRTGGAARARRFAQTLSRAIVGRPATARRNRPRLGGQIGRASCRERVWSSVVAGAWNERWVGWGGRWGGWRRQRLV